MKKVLLLGGIIILLAIGFFILYPNKPKITPKTARNSQTEQAQEETNMNASFEIYTNGTRRIFTNPMYHNLSPDVYIEAPNPNIINVKKANTTWGDFFKTLPFTLTKDCLVTGTNQTFCTNNAQILKFYINSKQDALALEKKINAGDKLLVSYGGESEVEIKKQLSQ